MQERNLKFLTGDCNVKNIFSLNPKFWFKKFFKIIDDIVLDISQLSTI